MMTELHQLMACDDFPSGQASWLARGSPQRSAVVDSEGGASQVGPRPVWKDARHPLRLHPALRLTGIPTLVRWRSEAGGSPGARLGPELEAAATEAEADRLIAGFLAQDWQGGAGRGGTAAGSGMDMQALIEQLESGSLGNGAVQR